MAKKSPREQGFKRMPEQDEMNLPIFLDFLSDEYQVDKAAQVNAVKLTRSGRFYECTIRFTHRETGETLQVRAHGIPEAHNTRLWSKEG